MAVLLVALIVLSALTIEGDCLACETCQTQGSLSCTGSVEPCAEGVTQCVKGLENNTMVGGSSIIIAYKKCVEPEKLPACNSSIIFRSASISLRITRVCCITDKCNEGDLDVPLIDDTPNGLVCPTCFTDQSSDGCTATQNLVCNGNEEYCGSFTGTARRPGEPFSGYSIKGCHNEDACEVGILAMEASEAYDFQQNCTKPSSS